MPTADEPSAVAVGREDLTKNASSEAARRDHGARMATDRLYNRSLARAVRRTEFSTKVRAAALASPLFLIVFFAFVIPTVALLVRAVYDPTVSNSLPETTQALRGWDGRGLPSGAAFHALARDLAHDQNGGTVFELAKALNFHQAGLRSHILRTAREVGTGASITERTLTAIDPIWGQAETWRVIKSGLHRFTSFYLLNALDLRLTPNGLAFVPADQALYLRVFARTFLISAIVTLATLAGAFPLAWLAANLPSHLAAILIIVILLPFWSSILVQTAAWTVILQKFGVLNDLLSFLGLIHHRVGLVYSRVGLIVTMSDIQLPFTLLPIYSVLRHIPSSQMRAAYSLGARPTTAFFRIYLPQAMPGVIAGCLLTFVLCLGYYITPALVGGPTDQLISNFIANYTNVELNWPMAAALSCILLALVLLLIGALAWLVQKRRLRLI